MLKLAQANFNMIDGTQQSTAVAELEHDAKNGKPISLMDLPMQHAGNKNNNKKRRKKNSCTLKVQKWSDDL